jgi:hypothetical protein
MRHTAKRSRLRVTQGVARDATRPGRPCTLGKCLDVVRSLEGTAHPFREAGAPRPAHGTSRPKARYQNYL